MRQRFGFTKMQQYEIVDSQENLKHLLIPTRKIHHVGDIHQALEEYGNEILVKPIDGLKGADIWRIVSDGKLKLYSNDSAVTFQTKSDFDEYCSENFTSNYIAQAFIKSQTVAQNPFDVRVHVVRTSKNSIYVEPFVRMGGSKKITSNVHTGGAIMPTKWFLMDNFGDELAKRILDDLEKIATQITILYQTRLNFLMIDLGIDIGIELKNDSYILKLFEINAYPGYIIPGKLGKVLEIAEANLRAYHFVQSYLDEKQE